MREATAVSPEVVRDAQAPPSALAGLPAPRRPLEGAGEPLLRERARRRPRRSGAAAVLLAVALVLVLALAVHLWAVAGAWRERAQDADAERARAAATSVELQHRLDQLQADLDASDARVEQLAAEKARASDLREVSAQRPGPATGRS